MQVTAGNLLEEGPSGVHTDLILNDRPYECGGFGHTVARIRYLPYSETEEGLAEQCFAPANVKKGPIRGKSVDAVGRRVVKSGSLESNQF